MEHLLVVCWKAFGAIDFTAKFYPADGLCTGMPAFPFTIPTMKKRMERCYKQHLHEKHALGSTERDEAVKLTLDDIKNHTHQNEPEGSDGSNSESKEDERSSEKQMAAGKKKVVADQRDTDSSGPVTTTISFPSLRSRDGVKKPGRIKPHRGLAAHPPLFVMSDHTLSSQSSFVSSWLFASLPRSAIGNKMQTGSI